MSLLPFKGFQGQPGFPGPQVCKGFASSMAKSFDTAEVTLSVTVSLHFVLSLRVSFRVHQAVQAKLEEMALPGSKAKK